MRYKAPLIYLVFGLITFYGCGISRNAALQNSSREYHNVPGKLEQAYVHWKGTPYQIGGTDSTGVDCSAFVQQVLLNQFHLKVPRYTGRQMRAGIAIRRNALRSGDLIFFRTGENILHVGIVLDNNDFLHVSTSQGVTLTPLDNRYWSNRYLAARRVLN